MGEAREGAGEGCLLAALITGTATAAGKVAAGADMGAGVTLTGGLGRLMGGGCSDVVSMLGKAALQEAQVWRPRCRN